MRYRLINLQVRRKILLRPSFSEQVRKGLDGKYIYSGSRACVKELKTRMNGACVGQNPLCSTALTVDSFGQAAPLSQQ